MKPFLILFTLVAGLALGADKDVQPIPEHLLVDLWKKYARQLQLSDQYKQLQLALPQIAAQFEVASKDAETSKTAIKNFCTSQKLEYKEVAGEPTCAKPDKK